jgi:hypothetical protein
MGGVQESRSCRKEFRTKDLNILEEVSRLLVAYAKAVVRNNSRVIRTDFE